MNCSRGQSPFQQSPRYDDQQDTHGHAGTVDQDESWGLILESVRVFRAFLHRVLKRQGRSLCDGRQFLQFRECLRMFSVKGLQLVEVFEQL